MEMLRDGEVWWRGLCKLSLNSFNFVSYIGSRESIEKENK
jgi:hypothetical protein